MDDAPPPSDARRRVRTALTVALSAALLVALLLSVDPPALRAALAAADRGLLAWAAGLSLCIHLIVEPLLLWWILRLMGHRLPPRDVWFMLVAVAPLKLLTPAKSGVLFGAIYLRRRHGTPTAEALSAMLVDKAHNAAWMLSVLTLLVLAGFDAAWLERAPLTALAAAGATTLAALAGAWLLRGRLRSLAGAALATTPRLREKLGQLTAALWKLTWSQQLGLFVATGVIVSAGFVQMYLMLRAAGVAVPLGTAYLTMPLIVLAGTLPVTAGGVGSREAAILLLFVAWGSPEQLLLAGLLNTGVHYLLPGLLGLPLVPKLLAEPDAALNDLQIDPMQPG